MFGYLFKFDVSAFQEGIPGVAWQGVIVGRVESVCGHGGPSKVLKYVSQKVNICFEIYIVVITERSAIEGVPHLLCMLVVLIGNSLLAETAVEFVL